MNVTKCSSLSLLLVKDDDEEVGDVYQDDNSEAAILVNHDVIDDAIILVSCFRSPLPAAVSARCWPMTNGEN